MHTSIRDALLIATFSACFTVALAARTPQARQHPVESGAHHHPGEIFTIIRDGAKSTGMKAYGRKTGSH